MGDYTNMSAYYDTIMTSGYYDYAGIVDSLSAHQPFSNILEIGCGTGLILEEIARRHPAARLTGIDLTGAMLEIAEKRLNAFQNVALSLQNVIHFDLGRVFELAFSYGGVWYFVIDGDDEPFMVSHLPALTDNQQGIERVANHLTTGGKLLLGTQGPHHNYERVISNGMTYSQTIAPNEDGFTKNYYLADGAQTVMAQTLQYRTYTFTEACRLLAACGLQYIAEESKPKRFLAFVKT